MWPGQCDREVMELRTPGAGCDHWGWQSGFSLSTPRVPCSPRHGGLLTHRAQREFTCKPGRPFRATGCLLCLLRTTLNQCASHMARSAPSLGRRYWYDKSKHLTWGPQQRDLWQLLLQTRLCLTAALSPTDQTVPYCLLLPFLSLGSDSTLVSKTNTALIWSGRWTQGCALLRHFWFAHGFLRDFQSCIPCVYVLKMFPDRKEASKGRLQESFRGFHVPRSSALSRPHSCSMWTLSHDYKAPHENRCGIWKKRTNL